MPWAAVLGTTSEWHPFPDCDDARWPTDVSDQLWESMNLGVVRIRVRSWRRSTWRHPVLLPSDLLGPQRHRDLVVAPCALTGHRAAVQSESS